MESPSTAPAPAASTSPLPRPPISPSKLRLMCSYGGHILPRPHDKSLFYAGGESRIVALDRRSSAVSLAAVTSHLSRVLFQNRPFHLKYQLPNEDLDSLISVITDEDLSIMLEEHDRIAPPERIRLFLFPVKPESLDSTLLDPKSDSWFSDALKSTGILQKGQSADCGILMGMGLGSDLEAPVDSRSNSSGGGKPGAESLILETSSSFGSTSSSLSTSNLPAVGAAHCDEKGFNLIDRKVRVPTPASIESDKSVGGIAAAQKMDVFKEPLIQVGPEDTEHPVSDPPNIMMQKPVQVIGYPLSQPLDGGVKQQQDTQLLQGGLQYVPQYPGPVRMPPYYHVYQVPIHQPQHIPGPPNQQYPIYLVPARPNQYNNLSMNTASFDVSITSASNQHPGHPQTAVMTSSIAHKDVVGAPMAESVTPTYSSIPASAQLINVPSNQGQLVTGHSEMQLSTEPVVTSSVISAGQGSEFDENIVYNQIYKTQPSLPVLPSKYQAITKDTSILPEHGVQLQANHAKQQAPLHPSNAI